MAPSIQLYDDNDAFWDVLWHKIDRAEHLVMIATYDMDHKTVAGITMQKLINAAKRGVKVYVVIDDLNFYVDKTLMQQLVDAGGICINNSPFAFWQRHFIRSNGRVSRFFRRNHQKVKLVDDTQFVGSLNIADAYSGVRYGDGAFRDLNAMAEGYSTQGARNFFRDMLLRNVKYHKGILNEQRIRDEFQQFEATFSSVPESNEFAFLVEQPPKKLEISRAVIDMCSEAETSIRIIQPYVQPIEELEDVLVKALERGVTVEIVSARLRDQPAYKCLLNSDLFAKLKLKGAVIYEEPFKYLHMKAIEVDEGRILTMGSFNQDHWSFYCNNEANLYYRRERPSPNAQQMHEQFLRTFSQLKRESRLVNFEEGYSLGGYFEVTFWKLVLGVSHFIANNRR